ncbi:GDSL-type esterase/lipase family protein [Dysgonomonas sp. 520]|uniref:GDSL-type esterase/lipase family protein n=1 Tax=Dysgonomonas sp. 520 TaxID=2302931 RepID=UPI0013D89796|nr:GDSL-type esterase/lipase family protein [Dysgonomonas sp. 520]NDW10712.1 T9SS C-terminal target domain-containing protein [Dysgonomonas sp. 520]
MKKIKILSYLILFLTLAFSTNHVSAAGDFGAWNLMGDHNGMNCGNVGSTEKDLTLEFWIYLDEQDGKNINGTSIVSNRHDGSHGFTASLNTNAQNDNKVDLRLWFKTVNNAAYACWVSRDELSNKWNHIAFVISSKDKKASLYLNTELHSTVEDFNGDWLGNIKSNGSNVGDLWLAAWYESPKFHGKLADVRVWNTVRTKENIKDNYKKVQSEKEPGLQKYYTFEDEVFAQRPVKLAIADNKLTWEAEGESWDIEVRSSVDNSVVRTANVTEKSYSLAGLDPNDVVYVRTINNGFYSGWAFKYDFIKVGCVGDSNTYGAEASDRSKYAWPIQIRSMLGDKYETRNFGVNSALMMNHLNDAWKNKTAYSDNKSYDPDIIVIALGTNDSKDNYWDAVKFKKSYVDLINEFKGYSAEPEIYMAIPIKAYSSSWSINDQTIREKVTPVMQEISKEMGLPLIDLYAVTTDIANLMASDGIHPKDKGLGIMARKIADIMLLEKPTIEINSTKTSSKCAAYYWYKDNVLINDANEATYTATAAGNYKVAIKLTDETNDVIVSEPIEVAQANAVLSAIYNPLSSISVPERDKVTVVSFPDYVQVSNADGATLSLYNIGGRKVTEIKLNGDKELVDTASLTKGIYICKVSKGDIVTTTKIMK